MIVTDNTIVINGEMQGVRIVIDLMKIPFPYLDSLMKAIGAVHLDRDEDYQAWLKSKQQKEE